MNDSPAIAIPNLLYTYAMRFDDGDFDGAAALFDKGSVLASGHRITGREGILAMWRTWVKMYDGKPLTRHITTNPIIALADDGHTATCQSQWTVIQAAPGYPLQIVATGRYRDRFGHDAGGWHFVEREYLQTDLVGDSSAHTLQSLT
ncbi:nuclear transport factor 2 family protein [Novosphingobium sp. 17-62-19]|uniref:nuclear transport factor 2 family protein n=1 Tax=Novosphingobium sp. 17-62-19 TaxID=1970406 RepID=UPI0025FAE8B0|nr:nuclear transport factor 2 family protein [Novosphingobium sp. 17-62-19]HQS94928.1 nuclear transport factor 2 family protein [Novosphingobium sp.]